MIERLCVQADLPKLAKWFPILARYPLAPAHLSLIGNGPNVRTEMKMMYSGRIPWKFEPWQIPTNIIGDRFTSFTVAQGVRPFLEKVPDYARALSGYAQDGNRELLGAVDEFLDRAAAGVA